MKTKAIIFDVDGTLSDCSHRRPFYEAGNKKAFFDPENVMKDEPIKEVVRLSQILSYHNFTILVVTARKESDRQITEQWLKQNCVPYDALYMRANNDPRDDAFVKREILDEIRVKYPNIFCVFDDRDHVVSMWRNAGLRCFQVAPGNF